LEVLSVEHYKNKAPPFVLVVEGLNIEHLVLLVTIFYWCYLDD